MGNAFACTLFSSSKGNCTYVRSGGEEFLIDAGVSARSLERSLCELGTSLSNIRCIFVTHEHSDHINGIFTVLKRFGVPVYAPSASRDALIRHDPLFGEVVPVSCGEVECVLGETSVTAFRTPHDSEGSVCYRFDFGDSTLGFATDIGHITGDVESCLIGCDDIVIESNYDVSMLMNGPYPPSLKRRIQGGRGHLSNSACASFVPRLVNSGARSIVLAHLSPENNTPPVAYAETCGSLGICGIEICRADRPGDVSLAVAPQAGICRII